MSRTVKEGKRRRSVDCRGESKEIDSAVSSRHSFGSTEKIRRRNRKTWTRLAAKRRRELDKKATGALRSMESVGWSSTVRASWGFREECYLSAAKR